MECDLIFSKRNPRIATQNQRANISASIRSVSSGALVQDALLQLLEGLVVLLHGRHGVRVDFVVRGRRCRRYSRRRRFDRNEGAGRKRRVHGRPGGGRLSRCRRLSRLFG